MKKLSSTIILLLFTSITFAQISKEKIDETLISKGINLKANGYIISSQYTSKSNGVTHVYFRQTVNNIEIFNANSALHFDKNGNVVSFNNSFINNASNIVIEPKNAINYTQAVTNVASQLGKKVKFSLAKSKNISNEYIVVDKNASSKEIKSKMFYLLKDSLLYKVWNVEFYNDKTGDWWNKRVDVNSGKVIDENNWKTDCDTKKIIKKVKKKDSFYFTFPENETLGKTGNGSYNVFAIPFESPSFGNRTLVNNPANDKASPYGWHDVNGIAGAEFTTTRGNNVFAKEDTLDQDSSNGFAPNGGVNLEFDFPMNSNDYPTKYVSAAITNLFYWNNIVHDVFYNYGFDEDAGNFQQKNYKNGLGDDDFVFADAQDGSGTNNANFSTPPDGYNPVMQMFIWQAGSSNNIFNIISPDSIKGQYLSATSSFGPILNASGVNGNLEIGLDNTITPNLCCSSLVNNLTNKIALIDRGDCFFVNKVYNAQLAGAKAAIIINNIPGAPFSMGSGGNGLDKLITIPSVMISQSFGEQLKNNLNNNVTINVTLVDSSGGPKYYDSDLDNGVIIHEYTHGLSNRLTGGPNNTSCLSNGEQGGEGWSDFFALALTAKATDNPQIGRGIGTYLIGEDTLGVGIRDYPYSRNMSVNPATYNSIKTNSEVHFVGFVWCTVLYDILWDLVDKYGFSNDIYNGKLGNNKAMQLVMDGLKLQPCSPGFVDARDAILLADSLNNKFENKDLLWKAFARRGLGYKANQGSSNSTFDGTESFEIPPPIKNESLDEMIDKNQLKLFPNPSNGIVEIENVSSLKIDKIIVFDLMGKELFTKHFSKPEIKTKLDLSSFQNGMYLINIILENNQKFTQKIIKE
ncbi:MAG: T9SS-dependent M36 family metallopeptidase [Bacteroidia bacterium]